MANIDYNIKLYMQKWWLKTVVVGFIVIFIASTSISLICLWSKAPIKHSTRLHIVLWIMRLMNVEVLQLCSFFRNFAFSSRRYIISSNIEVTCRNKTFFIEKAENLGSDAGSLTKRPKNQHIYEYYFIANGHVNGSDTNKAFLGCTNVPRQNSH